MGFASPQLCMSLKSRTLSVFSSLQYLLLAGIPGGGGGGRGGDSKSFYLDVWARATDPLWCMLKIIKIDP